MLCAVLYWRYMDETLKVMRRIQSFVKNHPIVAGTRRNHFIIYLSGMIKKYWFTLPILILVSLVYI